MNAQAIATIRVELPHATGRVRFFFVSPLDAREWHPWWGELFGFLASIGPREYVGIDEDGAPMECAVMTGEVRREFLRFLKTAPASEVSAHRTLRSALKMLSESELDVGVRYFGRPQGCTVDAL